MQRRRQLAALDAASAPLRMAAEVPDLAKVRALAMGGGVDIDGGGKHGVTALHRAADRGRENVVRFLLQSGADHGRQTKRGGTTALMMAAHRGSCGICELLLQAGASVSAKNSDGWDAMMMASARQHTDVVMLLARANGCADRCSPGGTSATELLAAWHGNSQAADRARTATLNSGRAGQQLRHWHEQQHAQQAQHADAGPLDGSVGTPTQSDDGATSQEAELPAPPVTSSPRDIERDVRQALADAGEQKRQEEEARIALLLQRSKVSLTFAGGGQDAATPTSTGSANIESTQAAETGTAETAVDAVGAMGPDARQLSALAIEQQAPAVGGADTGSTVRDQHYDDNQEERRARIEAMRRELEVSLAS